MSTNIDMEIENGGQLSRDFLKENLQTLWVDGIIVLDAEGKTDCEYSTDESLANEITEYLQKEIIMNFAGYEERSYSERFTREDGSFIDIAACARKDAPGIVAIYYYTSPEFARNYTLTIQGLLNGYSIQKDGTIIVADDGIVVASNNESLLGQNTADNEVVQAMKKHTDSQHIYHLKNEGTGCYGIMLKQRDYYIYAYLPDKEVFHNLLGHPRKHILFRQVLQLFQRLFLPVQQYMQIHLLKEMLQHRAYSVDGRSTLQFPIKASLMDQISSSLQYNL